MDEIAFFTALLPQAPDPAGVTAARERLTAEISRTPTRARPSGPSRARPSRKARIAVAGGLITAAAGTTIIVPAVLPDGGGGSFTGKAWAVDRRADGTVTVTVKEEFRDPAGLQRALRADGIRAYVRTITFVTVKSPLGLVVQPTCVYRGLDLAPAPVNRAVVTTPTLPSRPAEGPFLGWSWVIHPAAMPPGSALFIQGSSSRLVIVIDTPVVLMNGQLPACTPVRR